MTTNELRNQIVTTAQKYIGAREGSAQHRHIVDTCNIRKAHHRGYALTMKDPWCAGFTSAIAIECGMTDIIPTEVSCAKLIEKAKKMGIWQEADDYKAQPADLILYDWDDSGKGDNTGSPDHVGIVEERKSGSVTVIEGNYSNTVKRRTLAVGGKYIRGYICPNYASKATVDLDDLAMEVIGGKWGNGAERKAGLTAAGHDYWKVQNRVNDIIERTVDEVIDGKWGNNPERKQKLAAAGFDPIHIQILVNDKLRK